MFEMVGRESLGPSARNVWGAGMVPDVDPLALKVTVFIQAA
jgi:hypothetical protein